MSDEEGHEFVSILCVCCVFDARSKTPFADVSLSENSR